MIIISDTLVNENPLWYRTIIEDKLNFAHLDDRGLSVIMEKLNDNLSEEEFKELLAYVNQYIDTEWKSASFIQSKIQSKMEDEKA